MSSPEIAHLVDELAADGAARPRPVPRRDHQRHAGGVPAVAHPVAHVPALRGVPARRARDADAGLVDLWATSSRGARFRVLGKQARRGCVGSEERWAAGNRGPGMQQLVPAAAASSTGGGLLLP